MLTSIAAKRCITANGVPVTFNTTNSYASVPSHHYEPTSATKEKEENKTN